VISRLLLHRSRPVGPLVRVFGWLYLLSRSQGARVARPPGLGPVLEDVQVVKHRWAIGHLHVLLR
jgi:hypothetical protein